MVSFSRLLQEGLTHSCVDQERHNIIPQGLRCTLSYDWSRYLQYYDANINAVLTFVLLFFSLLLWHLTYVFERPCK